MNEAPRAGAKPSTVAITNMLAEAEVARRRALRPWLLATLLPLLLGGVLLGFTSYAVYTRIQRLNALDLEIKEKERSLDQLKAAVNDAFAGLNDPQAKSPKQVKQLVVNALTSDPSVAAANPRVYIHIHSEQQRPKAQQVSQALKTAGYILPGTEIELVSDLIRNNQVRYFRAEDEADAKKVVGILEAQGLADTRLRLITGLNAPPGQLEVWFATPAAGEGPQPQPADNRNPKADAVRDRLDRLQDFAQNGNRPAQNANRLGQNANRRTVRPRPDGPSYPARPPQ